MASLLAESLAQERQTIVEKLTLESVTSSQAVSRLTSEQLDLATIAVLSARLGEERLAHDIATTLFLQATPNVELTRSYESRVQFLPDQDLADEPRRYFAARVCVRYRRNLTRTEYTFGISDDFGSVTNRIGIPGPLDVVWHANRMGRYAYNDPHTFRVEYVRIDDNELNIVAAEKDVLFPNGQKLRAMVHTATSDSLAELMDKEVEISYCFVTKVPRLGHMIHFPLTQTCAGVRFEFDLGDVGIERSTLIPFFMSASRPLVREERFGNRVVASAATSSWVLPGGGIVLTWKLAEESGPSYVKRVYGKETAATQPPSGGAAEDRPVEPGVTAEGRPAEPGAAAEGRPAEPGGAAEGHPAEVGIGHYAVSEVEVDKSGAAEIEANARPEA